MPQHACKECCWRPAELCGNALNGRSGCVHRDVCGRAAFCAGLGRSGSPCATTRIGSVQPAWLVQKTPFPCVGCGCWATGTRIATAAGPKSPEPTQADRTGGEEDRRAGCTPPGRSCRLAAHRPGVSEVRLWLTQGGWGRTPAFLRSLGRPLRPAGLSCQCRLAPQRTRLRRELLCDTPPRWLHMAPAAALRWPGRWTSLSGSSCRTASALVRRAGRESAAAAEPRPGSWPCLWLACAWRGVSLFEVLQVLLLLLPELDGQLLQLHGQRALHVLLDLRPGERGQAPACPLRVCHLRV